MIIVSEQQTFAKLRLPPRDFLKMLDEDEASALAYVQQLQGEREKTTTRKAKEPKDPNAPKQRRKSGVIIDFTKLG